MNPKSRILVVLFLVAFAVAVQFLDRDTATVQSQSPGNNVLARQLALELGQAQARPKEMHVSSGVMYTLLEASGEIARRSQGFQPSLAPAGDISPNTLGCRFVFKDGTLKNIRVNQDCGFRRQAEEVVAVNPTNQDNLIAGQNDSLIGFNHCGYEASTNRGKKWTGNTPPPFYQFISDAGHTFDACSDPTATFDSAGNSYVGGVVFDVFSPPSAFLVAKSDAAFKGKAFYSPAAGPLFSNPPGVVANDFDPNIFHDKEFIVADATAASPKADNVYGTWTRFNASTGEGVGGNSPIYFSQSTDGGATWSEGIEISGGNSNICTVFSGSSDPNACDQDQGSHPIVGPDGTIYVAFGNGNTPLIGINQVLFVKCLGTADCTNPANWTTPQKVGDLIDNHPTGPSAEGCPAGRQCLPPNGYRVPEFTSISISVGSNDRLYVVWSDFRNGGPPCDTGDASTSTPPCDNDVFYSRSNNGGSTWSDAFQLTPPGSAQWQPWSYVNDKTLYVAYYDRRYGSCEFDGCNDITLTTVKNANKPDSAIVTDKRITTSSMPNLTPANNPVQAGFLGDYMWIAKLGSDQAVIWSDTRGRDMGFPEEDIYIYIGRGP